MTFSGSPIAPMFVLRKELPFSVPECARPRALKATETLVYRRQQKQDTKCTTYEHCTYDFRSCLFPKFEIMHFQTRDIKRYTVVLLFLFF